MDQLEIIALLQRAHSWRQVPGSGRPPYIGTSYEQLAWTRPVLTYALLAHDFLSSSTIDLSVLADKSLDVVADGRECAVVVDYGITYYQGLSGPLDLVLSGATVRLWPKGALEALWMWQESATDSPQSIAFDTNNVLVSFVCDSAQVGEIEQKLRGLLTLWNRDPFRQFKIYSYPLQLGLGGNIRVRGCFDLLNGNGTVLVPHRVMTQHGLNDLPSYFSYIGGRQFLARQPHWWTSLGFYEEFWHLPLAHQRWIGAFTALESLVGSKTNHKDKLAARIGGICGNALDPFFPPNVTLTSFIQSAWDVRSDIVHGNEAGEKVMSDWISKMGDTGVNLMEDVLRSVLLRYTMLKIGSNPTKAAVNSVMGQWLQRRKIVFPTH